ncbi:antibiotic biosynthesis monooxygenase family protein [Furfurilactobacillus curtus]|uniref:ABM domain-containing protein n=1 Tax=Furfurilactobacillus curtus TaxID=1746200 RepID=A0ABQ5JLH8_9LACO
MANEVTLAFGTKPILQKIQDSNPQNRLISLSETSGVAHLMLLDLSERPNVFSNPIRFEILADKQPAAGDANAFYSFLNLQLDEDHTKILRASVDHFFDQPTPPGLQRFLLLQNRRATSEYVLLSIWDHVNAYHEWIASDSFSSFKPFYKQSQYNFRETSYNTINLNK